MERKWIDTLREYKESSGSTMSGCTLYNTVRTGWGATQGPVYSDPSNGFRNVWSESCETSRTHYWHYYRHANASGSADSDEQARTMITPSRQTAAKLLMKLMSTLWEGSSA